MPRRKTPDRKKYLKDVSNVLLEKAPIAVERLCKILEDEETSSSTALSAAKEILERSIGKGVVCEEEVEEKDITITLKVVE